MNQHPVMVSTGVIEKRVVHQSVRRPQTGFIHYHGKRQRVYIGFWNDCPIWKLVSDPSEEQAYRYCQQKTMPIEQDPDYHGNEVSA
jgi:hypothetical protein